MPERQPNLIRFMAMTMDERWVLRTPEAMAEHALAAWSEERFPMVLDDLRHLPGSGAVIAEGAGLLPRKVAPLLTDNRCALWLVATPDCIRQVRTVCAEDVSQGTSDRNRAFENLVARDILWPNTFAARRIALALPEVWVDAHSLAGIAAIIERHFTSHLPGMC